MSNKKAKLSARILAIILCVLMVVSLAFYSIYMIVDAIRGDETEESDEHNHAAAPVDYTFSV
ncbi:MAG: hypothetical protein IJW51_01145 [Clostridia bacterium]|nr:hypothetical protein [Clostridia bacterium]